jgi:hypothetical protein
MLIFNILYNSDVINLLHMKTKIVIYKFQVVKYGPFVLSTHCMQTMCIIQMSK